MHRHRRVSPGRCAPRSISASGQASATLTACSSSPVSTCASRCQSRIAAIAIICFERWRRTRSPSAAAGYCLGSSFAIWFNLTSAPLVAAPMIYQFLRLAMRAIAHRSNAADRGDATGEWRASFALGAAALASVALPLFPARDSLLALGEIHGSGGLPSLETWLEVVRMHAGTRSPWLTAIVIAALGRGVWVAVHRSADDRNWAALVGFAAAFHVAGLVILGPDQLDNPIVINRYLLVLLPFGLSFAAIGLSAPLGSVPRRAQFAAVAVLALGLFATGPLRPSELSHTSFGNAPTYTYFVRDGNTIAGARLPAFYTRLAEASARGNVQPVIEYPWFNVATHAFDAYQKHHRQPLQVAPLAQDLQDPRLALRNMVAARANSYLESDARWLVVHLDLQNEERRVDTSDRNHWMRLEARPAIWEPLQQAGPVAARNLEGRWGAPDFSETGLRVWDLERVRKQRAR